MGIVTKKIYISRNQGGMSLMELLVAMTIFIILASVVLMSFQGVRKHDELRQSAQELASRLREIQNLAMTGQLTSGSVPAGGYGIHIVKSNPKYLLFADINANERYEAFDTIIGGSTGLKKNVVFDAISVQGASTADVDIAFLPPKPIPYVGSGAVGPANPSVAGQTAYLCLRHQATNQLRKITVIGASGQINEELVTACP